MLSSHAEYCDPPVRPGVQESAVTTLITLIIRRREALMSLKVCLLPHKPAEARKRSLSLAKVMGVLTAATYLCHPYLSSLIHSASRADLNMSGMDSCPELGTGVM